MMRFVLGSLLFAACVVSATAQNVKIQTITIETQSPNSVEFLQQKKFDKPAKVIGVLRLPAGANEKLPAVILMHNSGGVGPNIHYWETALNQLGIATFAVDSFTGRGVKNTIADQTQVSNYSVLYDSYRALELLNKHPAIDPQRIAVMGFSKGGITALYSAMNRFQNHYGPAGVKFAAHLAFYPACNTSHIDEIKVSKAPIRIFHGIADDYTLIGPCRDYVARLKAENADAAIFEYPGAHHSFDNPSLTQPVKLTNAATSRKCILQEKPVGIIKQTNGDRYDAKANCVERGTTVAHSASALLAARQHVTALLKDVFKLK